MTKTALINDVTDQDGAYLPAKFVDKGYEVHAIRRCSSSFNTERFDELYQNLNIDHQNFTPHFCDLTLINGANVANLIRIVQQLQPDEIYNLGGMNHVAVTFEEPGYTADGMGTLRLLETIRILGLAKKTRFYQASTSGLYGVVQQIPQKETTPFYPRSPYAVAKKYAYWITVNYREACGIYACHGILFNHESPIRGDTFVTSKITRAIARIPLGLQNTLHLGTLSALRDWNHAREWLKMLLSRPQIGDLFKRQRSFRTFKTYSKVPKVVVLNRFLQCQLELTKMA